MALLRRVPGLTWTIAVLIVLALMPEAIPLGPIRSIARYMLVAYLPGALLWRCLRPLTSLVDLVLYPSLLSLLPFAWVVLGGVALGLDLRAAGWVALWLFVIGGVLLGWSRPSPTAPGEIVILIIAVAIALLLLVVPFAANAFQAAAWDAPLHAAIVSRILAGMIPPDSPMMAGQPANYYWLYHLETAVICRLTGLGIYQVFACLNVHALVLLVLASYRAASRLSLSVFGRIGAAWAIIFGLNAFGWIIFLEHGTPNPDRWFSLLVPFEMVSGYSPSLGSLIHEFLDGGPFAMSFAFELIWLDAVLARINRERGATLLIGTLVLASALYLHLLSTVFVLGASLAAVVVLVLMANDLSAKDRWGIVRDIGAMALLAVLVSLPYAWNVLHAKTGEPVSVTIDFEFMKRQALSIAAGVGLLGGLAAPAVWSAIRYRARESLFFVLFAGAIMIAALITRVALDAEYKFIYLLVLALGPLAAAAWDIWHRTIMKRSVFVLALAICVPTNLFTTYAFTIRPPRETREPSRNRLLEWIRDRTPANSIFVEDPYWTENQGSNAAYFYLDRYWFDIAVYAGRRQLIGYTSDVLEQWGYRDIDVRQALTRTLTNGQQLSAAEETYLAALGAPIFLAVGASAHIDAFDPSIYTVVYEDGGLRAYRVTLTPSGVNREN